MSVEALFNVKRSEVQGPLLQFQSTILKKDDVEKLIASVNASCAEDERLEEARLKKVFDVWWPQLEKELNGIEASFPTLATAPAKRPKQQDKAIEAILEELLDLSRTQQKLLRSPEELLPLPYLREAIDRISRNQVGVDPNAIGYLVRNFERLKAVLESSRDADPENSTISEEVWELLASIDGVVSHFSNANLRAIRLSGGRQEREDE